ncbi:glucan endo-1,3-beta-glucosidase 12-like isoform X2 [Helianthus annuus]|uniref:glucan endo-1,3-beta-glucosidase 12-like isoform X2 n=1 Tax=Helianthus annuus TaxID=4232 RepID=UPI0016533A9D|nr:glucan endo-1,3-beta-glucosidase 12-like isoform X2 [Helianthus annuus]
MLFTSAFNRLSFYSSPVSSRVYSRPSSPTRVNLHGLAPVTSSSVKFSLASRSGSPNRSATLGLRGQFRVRILEKGGACFLPDNLINHASIAMNIYYQCKGRNPWNCHFGNSGLITLTDPSYGGCPYA